MTFKLKKLCLLYLALFLCSSILLQADWNQDFDGKSTLLVQQLPALQNAGYSQNYEFFKKIRSKLLKDSNLIQQIQNTNLDTKIIVKREDLSVIIKKRKNDHISDLYPWELSYITGASEFIVPSFAMEIGGKRVIVQKLESFRFGNFEGDGYPKGLLTKVSLEDYWKALLQAYVLGLSDLVGPNIGVNDRGIIQFFDLEGYFNYYNIPFKNKGAFKPGFVCQAFDWSQYNKPLDRISAKNLRNFVQNLTSFEKDLSIYLTYRPINFSHEGLAYRLDKLRSFSLQKGVTFRDFIAWIYPKMSLGLDELNQIVGSILKKKVSHGTSIYFVSRFLKRHTLSEIEMNKIQNWINTYID